jgi:hypothetical protein
MKRMKVAVHPQEQSLIEQYSNIYFEISTYNNTTAFKSLELVNKPVSKLDIVEAISDCILLNMFNTMAIACDEADISLNKVALPREQFYSKTNSILRTLLTRRKHGGYYLDSLGKILHNIQPLEYSCREWLENSEQ